MFLIQRGGNFTAAHTVQRHGEYPPHHRRNFFVNDNFVLLCGVHLVAVHRLSTDKLSLALLIPLDGFDLLGDVLGVHIIHDGAKWCNIVGAGFHTGVDAIQKRDIPYPMFGEISLHIVARHNVIAS